MRFEYIFIALLLVSVVGASTITTTEATTNATTDIINTTTNTTTLQDTFKLSIVSPLSRTYYDTIAKIDVKSNVSLDSLYVKLGSKNWMCTNCSRLNDTIILGVGDYLLTVQGTLDNVTRNSSVNFKMREKINNTNNGSIGRNFTFNGTRGARDDSRFGIGYEKLPQMLAAGNVSDAELANIIRNDKLNPGILNRLIKTGKLGNLSITAILDTQFQPWGIFKKFFGWMGFRQNSYSELIAENYNLTFAVKQKIVKREDLSRDIKDKINAEIEAVNNRSKTPPSLANRVNGTIGNGRIPSGIANRVNNRVNSSVGNNRLPTGIASRVNSTVNNNRLPPGLVNRANITTGNGITPPGQVK